MADINHLVGKWTLIKTDDDTPLEAEERVIEFYKDGSCLVHVKLFGGNSEVSPLFFFYQAFENHTIKFDSGEPGMHLYRFALDGDKLIVKTLAGSEFVFVKEEKKAKAKTRAVAAAAPAKAQKAQEEEFEREPGDNEWKCPKCGKIHQKYVGTCGCGEPKPKEAGPYIPPQEVLDKIKAELEKASAPAEAEEEAVVEAGPAIPEVEPGENEWKCPKCGKIHQKYVGTCGCGEPKPKEAGPYIPPQEVLDKIKAEQEKASAPAAVEEEEVVEEAPAEPEIEPGENEWKCPKCGKIHQKYVGTCGCGEPKPKEAGPYIPPQEVLDKIKAELEKAEAAAAAEEEVVEEEPKKKADKNAKPERVAGENEWKCPNCGKINQNYVGTCGCGAAKPKPVVAAAPVSEIPDEIPELEIDPAE
ncbi:MAG: hypothetical protein IJJ15_06285 [Ruminococcus sp.]|nr:hypothetical protein [Ruminococcus sp.]